MHDCVDLALRCSCKIEFQMGLARLAKLQIMKCKGRKIPHSSTGDRKNDYSTSGILNQAISSVSQLSSSPSKVPLVHRGI